MQVEALEEGVLHHMASIYRHDGLFSGLYRRMPLGWVLSPTTIGLSFAVYDKMCRTMVDVHRLHRLKPTRADQAPIPGEDFDNSE
jgi:hypothetical protein